MSSTAAAERRSTHGTWRRLKVAVEVRYVDEPTIQIAVEDSSGAGSRRQWPVALGLGPWMIVFLRPRAEPTAVGSLRSWLCWASRYHCWG